MLTKSNYRSINQKLKCESCGMNTCEVTEGTIPILWPTGETEEKSGSGEPISGLRSGPHSRIGLQFSCRTNNYNHPRSEYPVVTKSFMHSI
jgi:hypothetical protein